MKVNEINDLKQIVAENITNLRVANQMTQFELGDKINYSDKAVSRWERGEAIPDARVLLQLAEMFGVTVDYLLHKQTQPPKKAKSESRLNHKNIILLTLTAIWTLALLIFIIIYLWHHSEWTVFGYAVPVTMVVWLILNSVFGNRKYNIYLVSALVWSLIACFYFSVWSYFDKNWWILFLLGIPAQIIVYLGFRLRKKPSK
ncbi:MAG: helix-turn-helix transcriptional regulator [Clostridia bacterium]|nr:helix-turn-helix transcriptional regulator [Clostridia bacterium]